MWILAQCLKFTHSYKHPVQQKMYQNPNFWVFPDPQSLGNWARLKKFGILILAIFLIFRQFWQIPPLCIVLHLPFAT